MNQSIRNDKLYAQILRLLFKYNLVPASVEDEVNFIKELNELLNL